MVLYVFVVTHRHSPSKRYIWAEHLVYIYIYFINRVKYLSRVLIAISAHDYFTVPTGWHCHSGTTGVAPGLILLPKSFPNKKRVLAPAQKSRAGGPAGPSVRAAPRPRPRPRTNCCGRFSRGDVGSGLPVRPTWHVASVARTSVGWRHMEGKRLNLLRLQDYWAIPICCFFFPTAQVTILVLLPLFQKFLELTRLFRQLNWEPAQLQYYLLSTWQKWSIFPSQTKGEK